MYFPYTNLDDNAYHADSPSLPYSDGMLATGLGRRTDGHDLPVLDLQRTKFSTAIDLYLQAGPPWPSAQ